MAKAKGKGRGEPGGGEPDSRRVGSPEPGSPARAKGRGARRGPGRPPGARYSPEERRRLLEAHAKSGMTVDAFCATVGVSTATLCKWKRRYEAEGPRGLESRVLGRPKGSGEGSRLPDAVKAAVEETKRRFPFFGLRRIRDFLRRFRGIAVHPKSVRKVLAEAKPPIPVAAPAGRKPRRHPRVRRFERAKPGDLWQTDITSYVLARHHVRVYLVVFLDDHSRYVVSWALSTSAKKEMVAGCLMDGIQKYGKPATVLSDQGPQYFAWRGKSAFQRLLGKEGIQHSVARSHHPQTLGKCERLWMTVREELWERARPQELEEARERLRHYFAFYNFFRPHQGIEGGIPAERFFGAAEAVKRVVEERLDRTELDLAVGERPRKTVFVVGQVGDRAFTMHGEKGRVVVQTEDGIREALGLEDLGMAREEARDGRAGSDGDGGDPGDGGGAGEGAADAAAAADADGAAGGGGAGAVGERDGGGEAEGARGGDGDPRVVARGDAEGGGAGAAPGDAAAAVADEPDGDLGDGGGAAEATEEEGEGAARDPRGGEPGGAEEEDPAAGAGSPGGAGAGDPAPDPSLVEEGCEATGSPSRTGCGSGRSFGREGTPDAGSGPCSPGRSA